MSTSSRVRQFPLSKRLYHHRHGVLRTGQPSYLPGQTTQQGVSSETGYQGCH